MIKDELEKLLEIQSVRAQEKLVKLNTEWDSAYFINHILSIKDMDIDPWRIHIKLDNSRYVTMYFATGGVCCVFSSRDSRLHFRLYKNGTILRFFSTEGIGSSKSEDEFLISDLEDKSTAFSLSTIYEDVPLMVRYLDLYKNLEILRNAIYKDIKDIPYEVLTDYTEIINLENYRCLLSI